MLLRQTLMHCSAFRMNQLNTEHVSSFLCNDWWIIKFSVNFLLSSISHHHISSLAPCRTPKNWKINIFRSLPFTFHRTHSVDILERLSMTSCAVISELRHTYIYLHLLSCAFALDFFFSLCFWLVIVTGLMCKRATQHAEHTHTQPPNCLSFLLRYFNIHVIRYSVIMSRKRTKHIHRPRRLAMTTK